MLRILCITPWFPNTPDDPFYNYIYRSVQALQARDCVVTVLVTRPWTPRVFGLLNSDWYRPAMDASRFDACLRIVVRRFPSIPRDLSPALNGVLYRFFLQRALTRLVRETKPDVIHAHTEAAGKLAVATGGELNLPVVVTLHGINTSVRQLGTDARRNSLRATLLGADRVVLVGGPLRTFFGKIAGGDYNFRVVPNGFFLPTRTREAVRRKWQDPIRLISVSNLHEGKGIDISLQALASLDKEGHSNWSYRIVGAGAQRGFLERLVRTLGLGAKVEFMGVVPHERALQMLEEADVFVLPSYREAFGVAYLEAMGAGLLAIGVDGQGPAAFIRHGQTGLLVEPRSDESLASALRTVFRETKLMQKIAEDGRRLVWREYTWDRHAEKLIATYEEALRERSGRPGKESADALC